MDKMLMFLFLTFLLGVSHSQITENEDESGNVPSLNQKDESLEQIHHRSKRTFCSLFCTWNGGHCLDSGESDESCDYTATYDAFCFGETCKCCQDCEVEPTFSLCGFIGGKCKKKDTCGPKQYENNLIPCKNLNECSCCVKCTTPSSCPDNDGKALCVSDEDVFNAKPQWFPNPNGTCVSSEGCHCFNKCKSKKACRKLGGKCIHKDKECKNNFVKFLCGCKDDENCRCCVPEDKEEEAADALGCGVDN